MQPSGVLLPVPAKKIWKTFSACAALIRMLRQV
jgi:hypothetical protein